MFDYLIIGGGSAGCVLAARLSENPDINVALLEAGPADTRVLIHCPAGLALLAKTGQANWQFDTVPQAGLNGRTGYQPRGSCHMGNGPLDVVDARLSVRGIDALRMVDASIMPRVVGGNTNAPVIMIAEKAADMIKAAAQALTPRLD